MEARVVAALEAALRDAVDWSQVSSSLMRADDSVVLAWHRAAFDYMLVERSHEDYRTRYGPIAPMMELQGRVYPVPLDRVPAEATDAWAQAITAIDVPLLRARYGDLLWSVRHGSAPHRYAQMAIAGYEALASGEDEHLTATHAAQRAIELALELSDYEAAGRIGADAVRRADVLLRAGPDSPGATIRLLEAAAAMPARLRPSGLVAALELAEHTYRADPWLGDAVADLLAGLTADAARRTEIRRRQVARWQDLIDRTDGLARPIHIQHALELVALHQVKELEEPLRLQLEALRDHQLEWSEVSARVTIPAEELDHLVGRVVGGDSAVAAFARLALFCPAGDPDTNRQRVDSIRERHPLQFLVTRVMLSEDNLPVRFARTEDEHREVQLRRQEEMGIRLFATTLLLPSLDGIVERYGPPDVVAVAELLTSAAIDKSLAVALAESVQAVLMGEYDAAAHSLAPRVERALRELARQAGVIVVREPRGSSPGGTRSLGPILRDLAGGMPENWRRHFECLLTEPVGINLRNRIAHGLIGRASQEDAALLVHAVFAISQFRVSSSQ